MLTNKTKYALHALTYLAEAAGRGPVLIAELAREERIPKKFLERILLDLKTRGILRSQKGKGGGYLLARPATQVPVPCCWMRTGWGRMSSSTMWLAT